MPFELGYLTDFIRQTQDQSLKLIADHALGGRRAMLKPKPANANLDTLLRNANDTTCAVAVEGALRIGGLAFKSLTQLRSLHHLRCGMCFADAKN